MTVLYVTPHFMQLLGILTDVYGWLLLIVSVLR